MTTELALIDSGVLAASAEFPTIHFTELGTSSLLTRYDRRFWLPLREITTLLETCAGYRIVEVHERRAAKYRTCYYDTADLHFYHQHHAGRLPRHKIRVRSYLETGDCYLELKTRTSSVRTRKTRVAVGAPPAPPEVHELIRRLPGSPAALPQRLQTTLTVEYTRVTLCAPDARERITLDFGVTFLAGETHLALSGLVVAELKQSKRTTSPFLRSVSALGYPSATLSKYCLGIARLHATAHSNRFRPALSALAKLLDHPSPSTS